MIPITKIIQKSKFNNLDIIIGGEDLNKTSTLINTLFGDKDKYLISDAIYSSNKDTLDAYDYVLIDYSQTIQELALNFLFLSDLIIIPINSGSGSFKELFDLKNTLNQICRQENREVPTIKIVFNNLNCKYRPCPINCVNSQNNISNI